MSRLLVDVMNDRAFPPYGTQPATREDILSVAREMGEEIWWCVEHGYSGYEQACLYPWWYALENHLAKTHKALEAARQSCRMVKATLFVEAVQSDG